MSEGITTAEACFLPLQGGGQEGDGGPQPTRTPSPPPALPLNGREPSPFTLHSFTLHINALTHSRETPDTTSSRHPRTASRHSRNPTDPTRATLQRARCRRSRKRVGTGSVSAARARPQASPT